VEALAKGGETVIFIMGSLNNNEPNIFHLSARIKYENFVFSDDFITNLFSDLAKAINSKIIETKIFRLKPQGITAVSLLTESHINIHIWEELNFAYFDLATSATVNKAEEKVRKVLKSYFKGI